MVLEQIGPQDILLQTNEVINNLVLVFKINPSNTQGEEAEKVTQVVEGAAEVTNVRISRKTTLDSSNPTNVLEVGKMTPVTKLDHHSILGIIGKNKTIGKGTREVAIGEVVVIRITKEMEEMGTRAIKARETKAIKARETKATNAR